MFKVLFFFSSFLEKVILLPIAFELYPLYHYKQTNKQTNKQTKTNKTKQNKKTKTKISFRLLEWTPLTLFVKSYFFACRFYKELSLLFIQQSYLRLFTLTGSEGNTANKNKLPSFGVSTPNIVCKILLLCMQILQRIIFTFHTAVIFPFVYINRFWRRHCAYGLQSNPCHVSLDMTLT